MFELFIVIIAPIMRQVANKIIESTAMQVAFDTTPIGTSAKWFVIAFLAFPLILVQIYFN